MSTMDWYLAISRERGVSPRCPFASSQRCPRFYLSTWVLNSVDRQPQDEGIHLRWRDSEYYPTREDEFPGASGGSKALHYSRFCPEVMYERFRRFASELTEYFDEEERQIGRQSVENGGPEWKNEWLQINPRHYTECPLYSRLTHSPVGIAESNVREPAQMTPKQEKAPLIVLRPTLWGMSIDLLEVWKRVIKWLSDRVVRPS